MKISIIGRTEILYKAAMLLHENNHEIVQIITSKEAPEYTKTAEDFKHLAKAFDIPFLHSNNLQRNISIINEVKPDIGISMNYTAIIPQSVIDIFQFGILNAHGGDLPQYRGNACQAWAIINREKKIGLCVHKMEGGKLDNGDILLREYLPIDINTKITNCWKWMYKMIPAMFLEAIEKLENNNIEFEKQSVDPKNILRCYPRLPEDGRINWSQSSTDILCLINASNHPYSGAYCKFEKEKMIIWDAELVNDEENFCAVPGQVTKVEKQFIEVACGKGKLRIKEIQINSLIQNPNYWVKSLRKRLT